MCRYASHQYKDHMACFDCRKTFKKWLMNPKKEDSWQKVRRLERNERDVPCPQCAEPMANTGLDFRAPKKTDTEAWAALAFLYDRGFAFHGCGCDAGGYVPPKRLKDIPQYLGTQCPADFPEI